MDWFSEIKKPQKIAMRTPTHIYTHTNTQTYTHTYRERERDREREIVTHKHTYLHTYTHTHTYIYIYIYIYIHTHKLSDTDHYSQNLKMFNKTKFDRFWKCLEQYWIVLIIKWQIHEYNIYYPFVHWIVLFSLTRSWAIFFICLSGYIVCKVIKIKINHKATLY